MICPLRSGPITELSSLLQGNPSLYPVLVLSLDNKLLPWHPDDRFPCSASTPVISSRHLYTGRRMNSNRIAFMLILKLFKRFSFDDNSRSFDTSSMVRFRSSPDHTPDMFYHAFSSSLTTKALYSSSMKWFDTSFRKPMPRGRPSS
jgi:hypothetical protein